MLISRFLNSCARLARASCQAVHRSSNPRTNIFWKQRLEAGIDFDFPSITVPTPSYILGGTGLSRVYQSSWALISRWITPWEWRNFKPLKILSEESRSSVGKVWQSWLLHEGLLSVWWVLHGSSIIFHLSFRLNWNPWHSTFCMSLTSICKV